MKFIQKLLDIVGKIAFIIPWGIIIVLYCGLSTGWLLVSNTFPAISNGTSLVNFAVSIILLGLLAIHKWYKVQERKQLISIVTEQRETIIGLKSESDQIKAAVTAAKVIPGFPMGGMMGNREAEHDKRAEKALFQVVEDIDVSLDDVRGMPETLKDISDVINVLEHTDDLISIGGIAPSGLLLTGAPGTGKTLIAKAIAGSCKMKFIPVSASAFVDKYVGEGASRVRMVFDKAREMTKKGDKVIIFIDEIDAICARRGSSENSERDTTLNQLLVEMDGFADRKNIFVIGATNRGDMLDDAILRPGRLDRTVTVPMPDKAGRKDILEYYLKKYRYAEDLSVSSIVNKTVGFSPADIRNLLNTAAVMAVCDNKKFITSYYVEEAYWKIIMKGNKRDSERTPEEDKLVAYHEAGHALVETLLGQEEVTEVTIIGSTSGAGGVTMTAPKEKIIHTVSEIQNKIKGLYGGRAGEEVLMKNSSLITTGASSDIRSASEYIRLYLERWGMNNAGLLDYSVFKKDGESLESAQEFSQKLYNETLEFMKNNENVLDALAEALLKKRTLEGDEVRAIIAANMSAEYVIPMVMA